MIFFIRRGAGFNLTNLNLNPVWSEKSRLEADLIKLGWVKNSSNRGILPFLPPTWWCVVDDFIDDE